MEIQKRKNALEIKTWIKGDRIIRLKEVYRFGDWTCESEQKPKIDLTNHAGLEITTSEYEWEMQVMSDGMGYEWEFPKGMKKAEKEAIEEAWRDSFYERLEMLGWKENQKFVEKSQPLQMSALPNEKRQRYDFIENFILI